MNSLLFESFQTCYGKEKPEEALSLAFSTKFRETLQLLYEELGRENPKGLVTGEKMKKLLTTLNLPKSPVPRYCSLTDFERIISSQFCEKQKLNFRDARKISMKEVFEKLRLKSDRQVAPESLKVLEALDKLKNLHRAISPEQSEDVLQNLTIENLVRTVLKQQAEMTELRAFIIEICEALKRNEVQRVAEKVEMTSPTSQESQMNTSLKILRKSLICLKPFLQNLSPAPDQMTQSCLSDPGKPSEKSTADDSGWISDCDEASAPSDPTNNSRSPANVLVPDLPYDGKTSSPNNDGTSTPSSPANIWTLTSPLDSVPLKPKTLIRVVGSAFCAAASPVKKITVTQGSAFSLRTRLAALSRKLLDTESKLGTVLMSTSTSSSSDSCSFGTLV